jgi:hypothetical protein
MSHEVTCERCGTVVDPSEWFCTYCGTPRQNCPDCGGEFGKRECKACGLPREAPCGNCGQRIEATRDVCPHCGYNPGEQLSESASSFSKKGLTFGGIAGLLFGGLFFVFGLFLRSLLPTSVSGVALFMTVALALVGFVMGFLLSIPLLGVGLYRNAKSTSAIPASFEVGRKANVTDEYKSKRNLGAANVAASMADSLTDDEPVGTIPSRCPNCDTRWEESLLTDIGYEVRDNGNRILCTECGSSLVKQEESVTWRTN